MSAIEIIPCGRHMIVRDGNAAHSRSCMIACAALTSASGATVATSRVITLSTGPSPERPTPDTADGDVAVGENTCEVNHVVDDHEAPDVAVADQLGGLSKRRGVRPIRDDRELLDQGSRSVPCRDRVASHFVMTFQPAFVAIARGDRGAR